MPQEITEIDLVEFPHPFFLPDHDYEQYDGFGEDPSTIAELQMIALSWSIRRKTGWQTKMRDPMILERWRKEALEQQESASIDRKLSPAMIDYVLAELEGYARLIDPLTGVQHACNDSVFCSHRSITEDVRAQLLSEVVQLENVPEDQKDWHPGSNGQVLDLVHPSLYCIVYGRTLASGENGEYAPLPTPEVGANEPDQFRSQETAWLPSDFSVAEDGAVRLASPYINNIHPSKTGLISAIESVLGAFVPMWERVLGSIHHIEGSRPHVYGAGYWPSHRIDYGPEGVIPCLWVNQPDDEEQRENDYEEQRENDFIAFPGEKWKDRRLAWMRSLPEDGFCFPEAFSEYTGALQNDFRTVRLRGRDLQVIVKLANIHLTPEEPDYPGGSWHVEGMLNERIVSTGIYYYDSENITDSQLSFRVSVSEPAYHGQHDDLCTEVLYGLEGGDELIQERGSVTTKQGMTLAFPNIYQHRVSPFSLADRSKPGHRKILALFLVDPQVRVPSATQVPAQQEDWIREAIDGALVTRLPGELRAMVAKYIAAMTRAEAEGYRAALMKERSLFVEAYDGDVMRQTFNMCEH